MKDGSQRHEWMPHVWEGACFSAWLRMLVRHRFAIHIRYWWVAGIISVISFTHSLLWLFQEAFHGHRLRKMKAPTDPIFVLGHWRSGTTHLHEMLICDSRHASPNTYQCFLPHHFLLTEKLFGAFASCLMPARRPMDDMPAGWDRPQEDEFALCMLGQPSPYFQIGFPSDPFQDLDALDLRNMDHIAKERWSDTLANFLRRISILNPGRRFVLKSPPHSARIPTLLTRFPGARFIHIVRNPYEVFSSTVRLWNALYRHHALQRPNEAELHRYVFETGRRLYTALEAGKKHIPDGRFVEVRFEDLVKDPVGQMKKIYRELGLRDFKSVEPAIHEYLAEWNSHHRRHRHTFDEDLINSIEREWGEIARHYGYEAPQVTPATPVTPSTPAERQYASIP